jgi:heat shock protein HslJ
LLLKKEEIDSETSGGRIAVSEPKKYQISFARGGELILISDCNRGGGKYEVKENKLRISSSFATLKSCSKDSLGTQFTEQLEGDKTFRVIGGELFVTDADTQNIMKFVRARF